MFKDFEDLVVGDFTGLSVEAISDILAQVRHRKQHSDADILRIAHQAANDIFNKIKEE